MFDLEPTLAKINELGRTCEDFLEFKEDQKTLSSAECMRNSIFRNAQKPRQESENLGLQSRTWGSHADKLMKKYDSFEALASKDACEDLKRQQSKKQMEMLAIGREEHPIWQEVSRLEKELMEYPWRSRLVWHSPSVAKPDQLAISQKRKDAHAAAELALQGMEKELELLQTREQNAEIEFANACDDWMHDRGEFTPQVIHSKQEETKMLKNSTKIQEFRKIQPDQHERRIAREAYAKGKTEGLRECLRSHESLEAQARDSGAADATKHWKNRQETEKGLIDLEKRITERRNQQILAATRLEEFEGGRKSVFSLCGSAFETGLSIRSRAFEQAKAGSFDRGIVERGNRKAHDGDVLTDALLFNAQVKCNPRTDVSTFTELYGVTPGFIQANRTGACAIFAFTEFLNWRFSMKEFHRQNSDLPAFHTTKFRTLWTALFNKLEEAFEVKDTRLAILECLQLHTLLYNELKIEYEAAEKSIKTT